MPRMNKIGSTATSVYTENGFTSVRYHSTEVVKFSNNKIILNSGSWMTSTTKNRMNQASRQFDLGFNVWQKDFSWFVSYKDQVIPFTDNMELAR